MKSLLLYIDKWYIMGAINEDNGFHKLSLSNNEDRIWLYFHNNLDAEKVEYGLKFKDNAVAGELNYYTDIFKLIPASAGKMYNFYGREREMCNIFEDSGLFSDLKNGFDANSTVQTYISFSCDLSLESQSVFLDLLEKNNFSIKEFVASINYLSLEYSLRMNLLQNPTNILVANACNENLFYSLYSFDSSSFNLIDERVLNGLGEDLRVRAIVEKVIDYINAGSRFLSNEQDAIDEHRYLSKYAKKWLNLLDSTPNNQPTALGNVHLKKQKGNSYPVTILKTDIDKRTSVIIEDIVRKMLSLITDCGKVIQDISNIVFIGDTFYNSEFKNTLEKQIVMDKNMVLHFKESDLPQIVSVYQNLESSIFLSAIEDFEKKSQVEKQMAIKAKQAKEAMEKAKEAERIKQEENQRKINFERNLKTLLDIAENSELKGEYKDSLESYKKARSMAPDNTHIESKINKLTELIAEQNAKEKQYKDYIKAAIKAYDEDDWSEAISQGKLALGVKPESSEAKRIVDEASANSTKFEAAKSSLLKVDVFIEQGEYNKAAKELDIIDLLGIKTDDIKKRRNVVNQYLVKLKDRISQLEKKIEESLLLSNFHEAVMCCEELIKIDINNKNKWEEKKVNFEIEEKKIEEKKSMLLRLQSDIDRVHLNEDWENLLDLCTSYLKLEKNSAIENLAQKANFKISSSKIQAEFDKAAEEQDWKLIIDLSQKNPILKEQSSNNRVIQQARDQIRKSKIGARKVSVSDISIQPEEDSQQIENKKKKLSFKKTIEKKPLTLLEDTNNVNIEIKKNKVKYPFRSRKNDETINDDDEKNDESKNGNNTSVEDNISRKRKFPKVKRN